jgi:hypothetical protein
MFYNRCNSVCERPSASNIISYIILLFIIRIILLEVIHVYRSEKDALHLSRCGFLRGAPKRPDAHARACLCDMRVHVYA